MGQILAVHCTSCPIPRTEVFEGTGMVARLFEAAPGWCPRCETVQTLEVVTPCETLRAMRDQPDAPVVQVEVPGSVAEVLALAVRLRERPRCERCGEAARRLDLWSDRIEDGDRRWRVACPRCEAPTLVVESAGVWD